MVNYNRLAGKLKEDLAVFSQKISTCAVRFFKIKEILGAQI